MIDPELVSPGSVKWVWVSAFDAAPPLLPPLHFVDRPRIQGQIPYKPFEIRCIDPRDQLPLLDLLQQMHID